MHEANRSDDALSPGQSSGTGRSVPRSRVRRVGRALGMGAAIFVVVELAVFQSGLYLRVLAPNSYAGRVGGVLSAARVFERESDSATRVVVLGDSRMAEGLSARRCNEAGPATLRWFNAALAGSTPRVWYYLMARIMQNGGHFDWVIVPLQSYACASTDEPLSERVLDAQFMPSLASFFQSFSFVRSFQNAESRRQLYLRSILRSAALRSDVVNFLNHPLDRAIQVAKARKSYHYGYLYAGNKGTLEGAVEWSGNGVSYADTLDKALRKSLDVRMRRRSTPEQVGAEQAYLRRWLGELERLCTKGGSRLVILRAPRGPLGVGYAEEADDAVRRDLGLGPDVVVLPVNAFAALETPHHFFDALHMNARGRTTFSQLLLSHIVTLAGGDR